jgi:hypothetical protein
METGREVDFPPPPPFLFRSAGAVLEEEQVS